MKYATPDPNRKRPGTTRCYENSAGKCDCTNHAGWLHAESWEQVVEWLDHGLMVTDPDGDMVVAAHPNRNAVTLIDREGDYNYQHYQILIEDFELVPPTSPKEERDALASIMEAMQNNRLT